MKYAVLVGAVAAAHPLQHIIKDPYKASMEANLAIQREIRAISIMTEFLGEY